GGTGVLSTAVTNEALRRGYSITMINRGNHKIPENVEHIKADKNDYETIKSALNERYFDAVMDYLCYTDIETERSVNFYKEYTTQYFYISSCAVYNKQISGGEYIKEDFPKVLPVWKYSVDKWASEQKLVSLFKNLSINYTIIRPSVTYGDTRIPYGISPMYGYHWTLCARILANKPIIRWNKGINRVNMTRVEDFAVGVVGLIGNAKAYNEAFNVCGDETPSFNDVLNALGHYLGKKPLTFDINSIDYANEVPSRAGEILGGRSIDGIVSNEKIKSVVPEFRQTIFLKEGIEKTINAYKKQNYQYGIDWKFDADTDRIIKKWSKKQGNKQNQYNTDFIDYLKTATLKDKLVYWLEKNKEKLFVKGLRFMIQILKNLVKEFRMK
ncbi:MAG: NAD-dependent epimerase/dehydratase family protein, partial [Alphaproteobacteria bacterium]|nr:NAD-dependent epimerase/dehydratase family protein [Alphaproteobacteria bacterium]